jgi:hypothetical protein
MQKFSLTAAALAVSTIIAAPAMAQDGRSAPAPSDRYRTSGPDSRRFDDRDDSRRSDDPRFDDRRSDDRDDERFNSDRRFDDRDDERFDTERFDPRRWDSRSDFGRGSWDRGGRQELQDRARQLARRASLMQRRGRLSGFEFRRIMNRLQPIMHSNGRWASHSWRSDWATLRQIDNRLDAHAAGGRGR